MVKKQALTIPNQLLRRARLERGWTQQVVANRIGAPNDVMVTRWERGTAFPSPYYVERLCQLFEQRASDLGLLRVSSPSVVFPTVPSLPARRSYESDEQAAKRISPMPTPQQNGSLPLLSHLPFIGREADMRALREIYQRVSQGQTQAVLLLGEAGIGKTHLASTFLQWTTMQGATLVQGRAFEMGGRLPYQSLVHALSRRLEAEQAPETLLGITWLSELSRILPELRERYPHLPAAQGDETAARIRLFEAVTRLGQAFCKRAAVVLFIDDVHWADAASLDVLHYAAQRWCESGTPLLLLLSLRTEALAMPTLLSQWLASLHHDLLPVTELTLGPLTQDETREVLVALGQGSPLSNEDLDRCTALGQWLFRETHGHPFYLAETLRVLLMRQILVLHPSSQGVEMEIDMAALAMAQHQGVLPPGVRRLILSQLSQLTSAGHDLVRGSALLGQTSSFEMLSRVADLSEKEALAALSEILGHGLLREVSAGEEGSDLSLGNYLFGHDKMREVIYTEMGETQRRLFHRRALAVCQQLRRPAAEQAHHARAAGMIEQALRLSLVAAEEAVRLLANVEASLHYTQALESLALLPETAETRDLRIETLLKLVQVSWMTTDVEQTLERLSNAEALARALLDQRQLAHIHYWLAVVYGTRNAMRQARTYAEQVLGEAQELGDEELVALASLQLSRVLILQGQYGPIEELLTPVIPVLERTASWMDWVYALGYLGTALAACGHTAAGVAEGQRAVEHVRRAGELKSHRGVMARHFLSIIHLFSGDYLQMVKEGDQIVEEAEPLYNWLLMYWGCVFGSWAKVRLGMHKEAALDMERAQAASQRLGGQIMGRDIFAAVRAELLLSTGQLEEALTQAEAAIEIARAEVDGILGEGMAQRVLGQVLARLTRWEEAEMHLKASLQVLLSGRVLLEAAHTQVAWGLLCRDRGDTASAQEHFAHASAQFEASGLTHELTTVQNYLAQIGQGRF